MKNCSGKGAFTLVELLTVLAVISILGCLLLPAMARTRIKSSGAGCASGLRQMMVGWAMYKDENNDVLLPNSPGGGGWAAGAEIWSQAATPTTYLNSLLAHYLDNHIEAYRCPADVIPSANGIRLRSRSMNCQMATTEQDNSGWKIYFKGSDLTCPAPQNAFIFADESMYSLDDGFLQMNLNTPDYPDVPANYHDGACGISFADGRAEIHRWMSTGQAGVGLLNVPYAYGVVGKHWPAISVSDVDYLWLRQRTACKP